MIEQKKLSVHFTDYEFRCPCCGVVKVDPRLIEVLESIRNHFGRRVIVTSGYRCAKHNKDVGGAEGSYHTRGMAADIKVEGIAPAIVADFAESVLEESGGVGRYKSWTHVDVRAAKARWTRK